MLILRNFCAHCREGPHESQYAYLVETKRLVYKLDWYALDVSALCSMSLVSKRLCPLAQEVLYHEFAHKSCLSAQKDPKPVAMRTENRTL